MSLRLPNSLLQALIFSGVIPLWMIGRLWLWRLSSAERRDSITCMSSSPVSVSFLWMRSLRLSPCATSEMM